MIVVSRRTRAHMDLRTACSGAGCECSRDGGRPEKGVHERCTIVSEQEAVRPELGPSLRVVDGAFT